MGKSKLSKKKTSRKTNDKKQFTHKSFVKENIKKMAYEKLKENVKEYDNHICKKKEEVKKTRIVLPDKSKICQNCEGMTDADEFIKCKTCDYRVCEDCWEGVGIFCCDSSESPTVCSVSGHCVECAKKYLQKCCTCNHYACSDVKCGDMKMCDDCQKTFCKHCDSFQMYDYENDSWENGGTSCSSCYDETIDY